MTQNEVETSGN